MFSRAAQYEAGFNLSLFTALGGFTGIRSVAKPVWDRDDVAGLRTVVQGLGQTGFDICRQLFEYGASLMVADTIDHAVRAVVERFNEVAVHPDEIHAQDVDILVPCAMGASIVDESLPDIKTKAIFGVANNQLAEPRHGIALQKKHRLRAGLCG